MDWTSSGDDQANARYGRSVASAGDVNGDGYDDVIVGAPYYSTPNLFAGKAYLYLGSATGLATSASWTSIGNNQASAYFGYSVASAGDVNGDGYDDVIIGAYHYSTANSNAGKAYLYLGGASGLAAIDSWSSSGDDQANAYYGYSVASAGDVNGDGYSDVIVGAWGYDSANSFAGKAYLYFGGESGLTTSAVWTSSGNDQVSAFYGNSVASAGDVNGDGYDDVIVGAYYYNLKKADVGRAYLYLGSSSGLDTSAAWSSSGDEQESSFYGYSVASAGDVNGDGYDDVLVGANGSDTANIDAGKVYLYLGRSSGLSTINAWNSSGEDQADAYYGCSVASAGDMNGDGFDDVIIGTSHFNTANNDAGKVYLYQGSINGLATRFTWNSSGDDQADAYYGISVTSAGDVNGDGYDEVMVGAYYYDTANSNAGKVYLYNGIWSSVGDDQANANFGSSVANAGDVNGDGYDDVIVGAYEYSTENLWVGKAYLYLGGSSGLATNDAWNSSGDDQSFAKYGWSVAGAGDVNGDGYDDVIVGAFYYDTKNSHAGKAYLYLGNASGLSATAAWTSSGDNQANAWYGSTVASAGDVNGDGYDDVIVGADWYDSVNSNVGKAYLYLGSASGLATSSAWNSTGDDQTNSNYGCSIASAGDVNGDGYDDVIVGASDFTTANGLEGKVYLYHGGRSGLAIKPAWNSSGDDKVGTEYGYSVASAGDVNGDGYDDVIVGARLFNNKGVNVGKAYLYLGSTSGLTINNSWNSTGDNQAGAFYGFSVSSAGDVNGDGYDDVIVGAHYGLLNAGKAYLYLGGRFGLATNTAWTSNGDDQFNERFGHQVASAGDVNGDGYDDFIIGAFYYSTDNHGAGKAYLYRGGPLLSGIYTSNIYDAGISNPQWLRISWQPGDQQTGTTIKFQVATSTAGGPWTFTGPDGSKDTYYTSPGGEALYSGLTGRFLRYRIYFSTNDYGESPRINEVSISYVNKVSPIITVNSPNGGEDWMKEKYYPITWYAEGDLNLTPVCLYYSTDNGETWTSIEEWIGNTGYYNWTVPNIETSDALIMVTVTDIYDIMVSDTSDASFAIDPPPPGAGGVPAGGGGSQFPVDDNTDSDSTDISKTKSNDDDWPWLLPIAIILFLIVIISIVLNIYLFKTKRSSKEMRSGNNKKQITRIDDILKNNRL
jgi:hypothetical protein